MTVFKATIVLLFSFAFITIINDLSRQFMKVKKEAATLEWQMQQICGCEVWNPDLSGCARYTCHKGWVRKNGK